MLRQFLGILLLGLAACASPPPGPKSEPLEITEVGPDRQTALTRQNIFHLVQVYDLDPLLFTKKIRVQTGVDAQSHPVLTLNTRYAESPRQLLSLLLHEQLHWWAVKNAPSMRQAISELKGAIPPAQLTAAGEKPRTGYPHLIICYLELVALEKYLGVESARAVVSETIEREKVYPWIYQQVIRQRPLLKDLVERHQLLPAALR
jgi:hypothetical protein